MNISIADWSQEKAPVKSKPEEKRKKGDEKEELKSDWACLVAFDWCRPPGTFEAMLPVLSNCDLSSAYLYVIRVIPAYWGEKEKKQKEEEKRREKELEEKKKKEKKKEEERKRKEEEEKKRNNYNLVKIYPLVI